jgi:hypothetical protein
MKYNFETLAEMTPEQSGQLNGVIEGLEVSGTIRTRVQVVANTELPDEKVAELTEQVSQMLGGVEVQLISSEH